MKKFSIKAHLLAGVSDTIAKVSPQSVCVLDSADPVNASRMVQNIIKDCEAANATFLTACKEISDRKMAVYNSLKAEADAEGNGKSQEEINKINAMKSAVLRKETDKIQAESTSQPEEMVEVQLSDEKQIALAKLMRLAVGEWLNSALYVEAADAIDSAVEVV